MMNDLSNLRVVVLDVGHGNCAVVHDEEEVFIVDAGPESDLLQYACDQNLEVVDLVLLSHADKDHIGGLVALLASGLVQVKEVRLNSDALKDSKAWDDLLFELDALDHEGTLKLTLDLSGGPDAIIGRGLTMVEILAPGKYLAGKGPGSKTSGGQRITSNTISAVLRVVHNGSPVILFAGDLDELGFQDMRRRGVEMSAPVLVYPHHGGSSGSQDKSTFARALIGEVNPSTVIFSIGRRGRGSKKPDPGVVSAIRETCSDVRIVCTQLSTHCCATKGTLSLNHLLPIVAQGRESQRCCAGSLLLPLREPGRVLPELEPHQRFISQHAATALCGEQATKPG